MRILLLFPLLNVLLLVFNYVGNIHDYSVTPPSPSSCPSLSPPSSEVRSDLHETNYPPNAKKTVYLNRAIFQLLVLILWLIFLLYQAWLLLSSSMSYIPFDTNLSLFKKNKFILSSSLYSRLCYSSASFLALVLLSECEPNCLYSLVAIMTPNVFPYFGHISDLLSKLRKSISMMFFVATMILIFSNAATSNAQYFCIRVLQIFSISFTEELLL